MGNKYGCAYCTYETTEKGAFEKHQSQHHGANLHSSAKHHGFIVDDEAGSVL